MGACQIDLTKQGRRLEDEYRLATPEGVRRFIDDYEAICSEAAQSNLDAIDMLVDFAAALDDAFLHEDERDIVYYMRAYDYDAEEIAGIMDTTVFYVKWSFGRAVEGIANYLGGTEGYPE